MMEPESPCEKKFTPRCARSFRYDATPMPMYPAYPMMWNYDPYMPPYHPRCDWDPRSFDSREIVVKQQGIEHSTPISNSSTQWERQSPPSESPISNISKQPSSVKKIPPSESKFAHHQHTCSRGPGYHYQIHPRSEPPKCYAMCREEVLCGPHYDFATPHCTCYGCNRSVRGHAHYPSTEGQKKSSSSTKRSSKVKRKLGFSSDVSSDNNSDRRNTLCNLYSGEEKDLKTVFTQSTSQQDNYNDENWNTSFDANIVDTFLNINSQTQVDNQEKPIIPSENEENFVKSLNDLIYQIFGDEAINENQANVLGTEIQQAQDVLGPPETTKTLTDNDTKPLLQFLPEESFQSVPSFNTIFEITFLPSGESCVSLKLADEQLNSDLMKENTVYFTGNKNVEDYLKDESHTNSDVQQFQETVNIQNNSELTTAVENILKDTSQQNLPFSEFLSNTLHDVRTLGDDKTTIPLTSHQQLIGTPSEPQTVSGFQNESSLANSLLERSADVCSQEESNYNSSIGEIFTLYLSDQIDENGNNSISFIDMATSAMPSFSVHAHTQTECSIASIGTQTDLVTLDCQDSSVEVVYKLHEDKCQSDADATKDTIGVSPIISSPNTEKQSSTLAVESHEISQISREMKDVVGKNFVTSSRKKPSMIKITEKTYYDTHGMRVVEIIEKTTTIISCDNKKSSPKRKPRKPPTLKTKKYFYPMKQQKFMKKRDQPQKCKHSSPVAKSEKEKVSEIKLKPINKKGKKLEGHSKKVSFDLNSFVKREAERDSIQQKDRNKRPASFGRKLKKSKISSEAKDSDITEHAQLRNVPKADECEKIPCYEANWTDRAERTRYSLRKLR